VDIHWKINVKTNQIAKTVAIMKRGRMVVIIKTNSLKLIENYCFIKINSRRALNEKEPNYGYKIIYI
jgi:sorbitol-specific phosphotransferase system component IIA